MTEKPPYRVPLISEILEIEPNGFTVASTFAGAGGSSTGYRMAGFRVGYANEFVPIAQESYRANCMPYTMVDGRDVKTVKGSEILEACGVGVGELDLFDGSPPCQAFSTAGKREKGWGSDKVYEHGAAQKNEELFFDYIRLRDEMMPRTFVAENVSGLVKGTAKGFFIEIMRRLRKGYRVEARLLDAQWLGVPQQRQRVIIVGVREDLELDPVFPRPLPYRYSVRDALPWLDRLGTARLHQFGEHVDEGCVLPAPTIPATPGGSSYRDHFVESRVMHSTSGQHRSQGDVTDRPLPTMVAGRPASLRVVHATGRKGQAARDITDEPSPTITAGPPRAAEGGGPRNHFLVQNSNATHERKGERRSLDQPSPTLLARRANFELENVVEPETDIAGQAIGREYDRLNPGEQSEKYFSLVRADPDAPVPTITAAGGQNSGIATVVHPTEKRKFSILEVKRLCSFPDDFVLVGTYGQQWERLGNSVPPLMARAVGEAIRDGVLIPARAAGRIGPPAGRSRARSTTARSRKGGGR